MPTASEIIERVKARYAGCRSYEDTGEITTAFLPQGDSIVRFSRKVSFSTAFVRPTLFHFELVDELSRGVAWRNERGVFEWNTLNVPAVNEDPLTLDLALARLGGSVPTDALRLLGVFASSVIPILDQPTTPKIAKLGEFGYFVIDGTWRSQSRRLWIDPSTFLIRRIDSCAEFNASQRERMTSKLQAELAQPGRNDKGRGVLERALQASRDTALDFATETTTIWHPRMDHDIDPKVFEFTPPG